MNQSKSEPAKAIRKVRLVRENGKPPHFFLDAEKLELRDAENSLVALDDDQLEILCKLVRALGKTVKHKDLNEIISKDANSPKSSTAALRKTIEVLHEKFGDHEPFQFIRNRQAIGYYFFGKIEEESGEDENADLWTSLPPEPRPLQLLTWQNRLASLTGRRKELEDLRSWAHDASSSPRIRILTGPGGVGKTRLAAELCMRLRADGWEARLLDDVPDTPLSIHRPTLYVIDYPEERRDLVSRLFGIVKRTASWPTRLRILFLTRQDQHWWEEVSYLQSLHVSHLFNSGEIRLTRLNKEDAASIFEEAYQVVRRKYGLNADASAVTRDQIVAWCSQDGYFYTSPLFITATAIHAAIGGDSNLSLGGAAVIKALVTRERSRLDSIGKDLGLEDHAASWLVGLAAVPGQISPTALERLADPLLMIGIPPALRAVNTLGRSVLWSDNAIKATSPDICAACLLLEVLNERQDLAPDWLWAVLQDIKHGIPDILGRLSHDISLLYPTEAATLGSWLAEMIRRDPSRAARFAEVLTESRPPASVLRLSIAVGTVLSTEDGLDLETRGRTLHCLAERLWEAGRSKEALKPIESAIEIRRKLALSSLQFRGDLGASLNAYGLILNGVGDDDKALQVIDEGIDILRAVAADSTTTSLDALGRCLNTKAVIVLKKDREAAAGAAAEVVAIYEGLASRDLERFGMWLARGLHNQSLSQTDNAGAERLLKRAVDIKASLADAKPWRHDHEFALSALTFAGKLLEWRKLQEANRNCESAVAIYERLFVLDSNRFSSPLLGALQTHGVILRVIGRTDDAGASERRRIAVLQRMLDLPDQISDERSYIGLLMSMVSVAQHAYTLDQHAEATRACDKALEIASLMRSNGSSPWNPDLHITIVGAYLNRGNAHCNNDALLAIEDYSAAIELTDEFEARHGFHELNSVVRILSRINRSSEFYKNGSRQDFIVSVAKILDEEERLCKEAGQGHYGDHEEAILMSSRQLVTNLCDIERWDLAAAVARMLLRVSHTLQGALSGETLIKAARRWHDLGEKLLLAGYQSEGVPCVRRGAAIAQEAAERLSQEAGNAHLESHEEAIVNDLSRLLANLLEAESWDLALAVTQVLLNVHHNQQEASSDMNAIERAGTWLDAGEKLLPTEYRSEGMTCLRRGIALARELVANADGGNDAAFLNNLAYRMALLADHCQTGVDLDTAVAYVNRALVLIEPDDDLQHCQFLDTLGYTLLVQSSSERNSSRAEEAIPNLETARQLAIKIGRGDLLPTLEHHLSAAQTLLNSQRSSLR